MRLLIPCMECFKLLGEPDPWFAHVEFLDGGRYELECRHGHRSVAILQEAKYEVLFEIAVNAVGDGYYREAVTSFAATLERFYEFAIGVLLEDGKVQRESVLNAWKVVAAKSERQLGAFVLLWLNRFKVVPALLKGKFVELRNDVVHKGRIPSKMEAIAFGDAVLAVIIPALDLLHKELADAVHMETLYILRERRTEADANFQASTLSIGSAFRAVFSPSGEGLSVEGHLAKVKMRRKGRHAGI